MKMKLDLSKFKLKSKNDKIATLKHPDGHEFRVAIHALHPENRKNLEKLQMADGGEAEKDKPLEIEELEKEKLDYEPIKPKNPIKYEKMAEGGNAGSLGGFGGSSFSDLPKNKQSDSSDSSSSESSSEPKETLVHSAGSANVSPVEYQPVKSNLAKGGMAGRSMGAASQSDSANQRQSNPKLEESKKVPFWGGGQAQPQQPAPKPGDTQVDKDVKDSTKTRLDPEKMKKFKNPFAMANGGSVPSSSKGPLIDPKAAKEMQKGATTSGWNPSQWKKNLKEGLSMADGGEAPESNDIPYDKLIPQEEAANAPYTMGQDSQPMLQSTQGSPAPSQEMPQQGASAPQASQAVPPNPADNYDLMHGAALQQKGIEEQANAEARAADAQAAQLRVQGEAQLKLAQNYQEKMNDINVERDNAIHDYQNQHIDPNRYMGSMNFGQRLLAGMAIGLGGVGGAMTHQENPALKFFSQQIDRDIEQQKSELGKRQTLLSANMEHFKNLQDATMMTKLNMGDYAKTQLDKLAAQSQNPIIKARAMQLKGQMEQQMAPIAHQLAMKQMLMGAAPGSIQEDPAQLIAINVPPDKQKEVAKEVDDAKEITRNKDKLMRNFAEADKENTILKTGAGKLREPGAVKELKALILPQFKNIDGTVREYAAEQAFNNFIPSPGDSPGTVEHKRRALMDWMESKQGGSLAKTYGIDLQKFAATNSMNNQQSGPQTKILNGNQYFKIPGGWKRVK